MKDQRLRQKEGLRGRGVAKGSLPIGAREVRVRAGFEQKERAARAAQRARQKQRREPVGVGQVEFFGAGDKKPGEARIEDRASDMERAVAAWAHELGAGSKFQQRFGAPGFGDRAILAIDPLGSLKPDTIL